MKLNIILRTVDYRGDHAADVFRPIDPIPGETLEALIERSGMNKNPYANGLDTLEIRIIQEES